MTKLAREADGSLVYEQAQSAILKMIEDRSYNAGDKIPSERDLSERFEINRLTLRKAIANLVKEGRLEKRGTSGTYVPAPTVLRPISAHSSTHSISQIVRDCGGQPGNKLLFFEEAEASARLAEKLMIKSGDPVIMIKRVRSVNGLTFCIETTWLPGERVPGLAAGDLLGDESLYSILNSRYGIKTGTGTATVSAANISKKDSELLGLYGGEFALIIHSVIKDTDGKPIEFLASLNHPNRVQLTAE
ncbi:MAG: GntR family transcriptional regulator [Pelagimonas sp.]|uniref:GntR family transcriptional regulator n=1 Tax=Pelagimonas sp. TaxID=2073170 RepID=UPI003D6A103C